MRRGAAAGQQATNAHQILQPAFHFTRIALPDTQSTRPYQGFAQGVDITELLG
jgi:hypothetical protein